jgi:hypothetical protein
MGNSYLSDELMELFNSKLYSGDDFQDECTVRHLAMAPYHYTDPWLQPGIDFNQRRNLKMEWHVPAPPIYYSQTSKYPGPPLYPEPSPPPLHILIPGSSRCEVAVFNHLVWYAAFDVVVHGANWETYGLIFKMQHKSGAVLEATVKSWTCPLCYKPFWGDWGGPGGMSSYCRRCMMQVYTDSHYIWKPPSDDVETIPDVDFPVMKKR